MAEFDSLLDAHAFTAEGEWADLLELITAQEGITDDEIEAAWLDNVTWWNRRLETAGSAGGFYRELLAAQALLVSCGQSAAGRRQLSRLAEASERLEAAARAGDATQEPAATEGPAE